MNLLNKLLLITLMIILLSCSEESNPTEPEHEHFNAYGLILESAGSRVLTYFKLKTNDTLYVPIGLTDHYEVKFLSSDSSIIEPPSDQDKKFGWVISDTSMLEVYRHNAEWEFHLKGKKVGNTFIEFQVLHNDHPDFRTTKIPVVVQDQSDQHGAPVGLRAYIEDTNEMICESYVSGSSKLTKGEFKLKSW